VQILSLESLDETAIDLAPAVFISCSIAVPTPDSAALPELCLKLDI
jgi:hypothetical protein